MTASPPALSRLPIASAMSPGRKAVHVKSMPEDWNRAVAVVAHPDDLEYGVAAAIAVERKTTPAELPGTLVRQTLHQQHAGP